MAYAPATTQGTPAAFSAFSASLYTSRSASGIQNSLCVTDLRSSLLRLRICGKAKTAGSALDMRGVPGWTRSAAGREQQSDPFGGPALSRGARCAYLAGMINELKTLFSRTWDAFLAEVSRRDPEDQVAGLLSAMRREMVEARAALPTYEAAAR